MTDNQDKYIQSRVSLPGLMYVMWLNANLTKLFNNYKLSIHVKMLEWITSRLVKNYKIVCKIFTFFVFY